MNKKLSLLSCLGILALAAPEGNAQQTFTGPSSSQSPYVTPVLPGSKMTSILTTGDNIGGYKMIGTPDGLGAFDNGNGTFTVLMNHELGNTAGVARAHGQKGAFVSKWVINKSNLQVISGSDLMQTVKLWNGTAYVTGSGSSIAFNRFCSADLAPVSAFYNATTGKGTQARIFMDGEEAGNEGRCMGHIATGPEAGTSYQLPRIGKYSYENALANPASGDLTIVAGTDDATPGQVYFYVGTKTNTGLEIEKAGLTNGKLYGPSVTGYLTETSGTIPAAGSPFTMVDLGNVENISGAQLEINSNNAGVTRFLRPEDGAWDPSNPNDFYFATTNAFNSPSRLWRLHFTDLNNLALGGTITAMLDGTEGQQMLDNITIDHWGHVLMVEDVGGNAHIGKTWQYTIATDQLVQVASHDVNRFLTGGSQFLTQDEEATGIVDVQEILGAGMFLLADQAHYGNGTELVEGGQLLAFYNPATFDACSQSFSANITVSPNPTVAGQQQNTIFLGYGPQTVNLATTVTNGILPLTYGWTPVSSTNSSVNVSPTTTTTYTVTVTNPYGCTTSVSKEIIVKDIQDGKKNKVFICHNGNTNSISVNAVPAHLGHGDILGACPENTARTAQNNENGISAVAEDVHFNIYPNPTTGIFTIELPKNGDVEVIVTDIAGKQVDARSIKNNEGQHLEMNLGNLANGIYLVKVSYADAVYQAKITKQ